ncbi:purine nucleoside permease [Dethiosulfovibrio sp. F2B]|uniref:purine nucleoside permease n=1 Tax=Dethiosulfovibrio faecalis TaxID=2720018 RepID=UPI001F22A7A0|nr:purine nucleoside permease [Dethiosulfovibrio faecalis]
MIRIRKAILTAIAAVVLSAGTLYADEPVKIKALVMAMFEIGDYSGDFAGEFQHFYEGYLSDAVSYDVKGAPNPLFVAESGVAGAVVGEGKAQAASTLTAILSDPRFDFDGTYFITSGCAGASPERSTLGSVVICDAVVDYELGHGWKQSDCLPGTPTFMAMDDFAEVGYISLNRELLKKAREACDEVELADCSEAKAYRALYPQKVANGVPSIQYGVSVTGDSYWHGRGSSVAADHVCAVYGAETYMVTQMEDSAFAAVLRNFGYLNRYLVIRDVVNFDRPHPGQTVRESLKASSGGFSIGMTNGYRVASAVLDHILANPREWEEITR